MSKKDEAAAKADIKVIEENGKKFYEKTDKMMMVASDYGIQTIKGSAIANYANLKVTFSVDPNKDYIMLSGYLNNKLIPGTDTPAKDSYGDVPTGPSVYDITRLINNPIALCNHDNDAAGIAGNFIYLLENAQGLQFREILRPLDEVFCDETKDAISAWGKGWGIAYSIGGRWMYDWENSDPETNTYLLVKAILHEASHVAIGADQYAMSVAPCMTPPAKDQGDVPQRKTLEALITEYVRTGDKSIADQIEEERKRSV